MSGRAGEKEIRAVKRAKGGRPAARRIVILGAGYGGIACVTRLARLTQRHPEVEIHLCDRNTYHLLETRLHEAAMRKAEVAIPIARIIRRWNVHFHLGEVSQIDLSVRQVVLGEKTLAYDYLVIALGSKTNFYAIPGLAELALQLKTLEDSLKIRQRVDVMFARARSEKDPEKRRRLLTFVIGGGGLTGAELAGEMTERVEKHCHDYEIPRGEVQIILLEAGPRIVPSLSEKQSALSVERLQSRGVRILTNTKVVGMEPGKVLIEPGEPIPAETLVWTGGIRASRLLAGSGLPVGVQGRILVDEYLEVKGFPGVFAVGDNALAINPKTGKTVVAAAQFALQQGRLVAWNIFAEMFGKPKKVYVPKVFGEVISLGRHLAVGWIALPGIKRIRFFGFLASLLKRAITEKHLLLLWRETRNWARA